MAQGKYSNIPHQLAKAWLDDAIAHANDEEKEKGERISSSVKDGNYDHQKFGESVTAMVVGIVIEPPGHQLFHDEEHDDSCNVILDRKYVVPILNVKESPEDSEDRVYDCETPVKGELCNLSCLELAVCISELHSRFVFLSGQRKRTDAIISSPLDGIINWLRILQMYRHSLNRIFRRFCYFGAQKELADLFRSAGLRLDGVVITDVRFL